MGVLKTASCFASFMFFFKTHEKRIKRRLTCTNMFSIGSTDTTHKSQHMASRWSMQVCLLKGNNFSILLALRVLTAKLSRSQVFLHVHESFTTLWKHSHFLQVLRASLATKINHAGSTEYFFLLFINANPRGKGDLSKF